MVDIVKSYNFLVKFEKVDLVCSDDLNFLLILICLGAIYHSDPCLCKVICHCQLRISVERNVLSLSTRIYLVISILQLSSIVISLRIYSSCVSSSSIVRPRSSISNRSLSIRIVCILLRVVDTELRLRNRLLAVDHLLK
jgi:hypothetical protein